MLTVKVSLKDYPYPIHIGTGISRRADLLKPHIQGRQILVVTNPTVSALYGPALMELLKSMDLIVYEHQLPDGEVYKDLQHVSTIFDALLKQSYDRRCTVLALGGGVIGDMAGFAAACYQRGVNFIQMPTTLLAQVDSSVGGKTGVNHPQGKNMIGAFKQPSVVMIDTEFLESLPAREFSAGLAEVIKYALIRDAEFFNWLESHMPALMAREPKLLAKAIAKCCQHKADVVVADEFEQGERALLNLGHTFGHAIESHTGYSRWLHGEAVAVGMVMAARLSSRRGGLRVAEVNRIMRLLQAAQLPMKPPEGMTAAHFMEYMGHDKKILDGQQRLILMTEFGHSEVVVLSSDELAREVEVLLHE
ncbi:MAG: 3-dehydroquinate synthase [Pseudomonadales bacterium]|nr:3-dehydroquinate synthase [Pseudomonadales bacterium]